MDNLIPFQIGGASADSHSDYSNSTSPWYFLWLLANILLVSDREMASETVICRYHRIISEGETVGERRQVSGRKSNGSCKCMKSIIVVSSPCVYCKCLSL